MCTSLLICHHLNLYVFAHLPVEDNTPDEAQSQLVVSIHNICPSYVYQINLKVTDDERKTYLCEYE